MHKASMHLSQIIMILAFFSLVCGFKNSHKSSFKLNVCKELLKMFISVYDDMFICPSCEKKFKCKKLVFWYSKLGLKLCELINSNQSNSLFDAFLLSLFKIFCQLPLQLLIRYTYKYCLAAVIDGAVFQALIFWSFFREDYRKLTSFKTFEVSEQ